MKKNFKVSSISKKTISSVDETAVDILNFLFRSDFWNTLYNLQMQVGQTVTFVSQGIVMPRGKSSQPSEPDAGAWLFDDTAFQLLPHDKNQFDKTQITVTLKALDNVLGQKRVRFVGSILGYDRKYDVLVEVTGQEKK